MHLRGRRPLGNNAKLFFRYRLSGSDSLHVALVNSTTKVSHKVKLKDFKVADWSEATVDFNRPRDDGRASPLGPGVLVDEIRFLLPRQGELLIDDVVLFSDR